jgi:phosphatidylinositol alpha-1,6-mannosyltransferase
MHLGVLTCELKPTHGWARYSVDVLMALHRAGLTLTVLAPATSPTDFPFRVLPILPEVVPAPRALTARMALAIPRVASALRGMDVVHTMVELYAPLAAAASPRPQVLTAHGTYAALPRIAHPLARPLYRWAFGRAARIIAVSPYTQRVLLGAAPQARTVVIPNGGETAQLAQAVQAAEIGPKRGPMVLAVGAVKARKGTLELVRAFDHVRKAYPDAHCIIAGTLTADLAYVERVRQEIDRLGLSNHVSLTGRIPEERLFNLYRTADVFALPAMNDGPHFEGFGLVYLEASAAGLPVIGTRDCGAEAAIIAGETGLLVSQERVEDELAEAIIRLLGDDALRARMGEAGRAYALTQTWDAAVRPYLTVYRDVVQETHA